MFIVDAHLDLSWNALQWDRDLLRPVHSIRTLEVDTKGKGRALGTVALPEMRKGGIALCFATLLPRSTGRQEYGIDYPSRTQSYAVAKGQLAYYRALESEGHLKIIEDLEGLNQHVESWESELRENDHLDRRRPPLGVVISMEGADPILAPKDLEEWWREGLRVVGIPHYGHGRYAGGTGSETGLTATGETLLAEMDKFGMILDLTHLSDEAFWQSLELYDGPVAASHNNCRTLVPHQRQLSDDQLKGLIAREGVVGLCLDVWMLKSGWIRNYSGNAEVRLADVADHIDYVCQLAGNSRHAAIGSDLDGGFGREQSPADVDTIADLEKLAGILRSRGYNDGDIAAILHGNWLRLLQRAWGNPPKRLCG